MPVRTQRPRLAAEALLWGLGLLFLSLWGLIQLHSQRTQDRLEAAFRSSRSAATEGPASAATVEAGGVSTGEPVARLVIPSIELEAMVAEGVDERVLATAVGHLPGTSLPRATHASEGGNVVLAAHRDSFFSGLRHLEVGDEIRLEDPSGGETSYRVDEIQVLSPDRVEVLRPTPEATLTLVTCYPFDFLGPAPLRWVVRASPAGADRPDSERAAPRALASRELAALLRTAQIF